MRTRWARSLSASREYHCGDEAHRRREMEAAASPMVRTGRGGWAAEASRLALLGGGATAEASPSLRHR